MIYVFVVARYHLASHLSANYHTFQRRIPKVIGVTGVTSVAREVTLGAAAAS